MDFTESVLSNANLTPVKKQPLRLSSFEMSLADRGGLKELLDEVRVTAG